MGSPRIEPEITSNSPRRFVDRDNMYIYNVHMKHEKEVSISSARQNLPSLVRDAQRGMTVTLTRRGEPVAVMISTDRYRTYAKSSVPLGRALDNFRSAFDLEQLDIESVYEGVRDRTEGRVGPF